MTTPISSEDARYQEFWQDLFALLEGHSYIADTRAARIRILNDVYGLVLRHISLGMPSHMEFSGVLLDMRKPCLSGAADMPVLDFHIVEKDKDGGDNGGQSLESLTSETDY